MPVRLPHGLLALVTAITLSAVAGCGGSAPPQSSATPASTPMPSPRATATAARHGSLRAGRIPPLLDPHDVYAAGRPGRIATIARHARALLYVPNSEDGTL